MEAHVLSQVSVTVLMSGRELTVELQGTCRLLIHTKE